jgi:putative colanic acid biosynthesis glycosyltransferase
MNKIFISIITITYNDLEGLRKTLESIDCNFKLPNSYIDHVIIDGNSNDGTVNYINHIAPFRKIKTTFISESDLGIYDAMNKGVLNSSSDFVIFINSGDLLLTAFFEKLVYDRLLYILDNSNCAGLALSCIYNFSGIKYFVKAREISLLAPRMPSLHQGIIYKRSILVEMPYSLNFKICGDFENICRIIKKYTFDHIDINISELIAGGVSTNKPISLAKESYSIYVNNTSPNFFNKIFYIIRLSISLLTVQFLFFLSKIFSKIISIF